MPLSFNNTHAVERSGIPSSGRIRKRRSTTDKIALVETAHREVNESESRPAQVRHCRF
jgi:hypothetical protein